MRSLDVLFWVYLALGPVAWALLAFAIWGGRRRMLRLRREWTTAPLPADPPTVTVLVPAKDEGERITACLDSILAQDYPRLALIAIDDRSTDQTGPLLDDIAARDARVTALHVPHGGLPQGWLGKCHALHVGAQNVTSDWILFVDSDVTLAPHALRAAMGISVARNYDVLSLLTRLECHTLLERLVLPLAAGAWSTMNAVSFTNTDSRPTTAHANGQFLLIRRSAYEAVGGHESVRDRITEDVELMRLLKRKGFRTRFQMGAEFAATRMHATFRQMLKGWGRIYSGTTLRRPWRILASLLFVLVCGFSGYVVLIASAIALAMGVAAGAWLVLAILHLVLMTLVLMAIYRDSGNSSWLALLFPISGGVLVMLFAFALRWCATGRIEWRGTVFEQRKSPGHT